MLGTLAVVYFGLAWLRLRAVARRPAPPPAALPAVAEPGGSGVAGAFADEYRRVLGNRGAFGLIVLAPIIYGLLYPQPYLGQLIKNIPIAVVDDDHSEISRAVIQAVDCRRSRRGGASTDDACRSAGRARPARGIRHPEHSGRNRARGAERRSGEAARLMSIPPISCSTTARSRAFRKPSAQVRADLAAGSARPDGSLYRAALARSSPVEILNQPLFNPTGGYGSYIVPAAFLLILQQTLLMGSATLGGAAFQQGGVQARRRRGTVAAVIGQSLAHLALSLPGFALFLVVLPRAYGFSASPRVLDLLVLAIPFILSVSLLGQFVGSWFKRPETAVLVFIAISLPVFFLVGVAWPLEAIPPLLRAASFALPSTSGIDALVRINQMGAQLSDVSQDWARLWLLVAVYGALAVAAARIAPVGRTPDAP